MLPSAKLAPLYILSNVSPLTGKLDSGSMTLIYTVDERAQRAVTQENWGVRVRKVQHNPTPLVFMRRLSLGINETLF